MSTLIRQGDCLELIKEIADNSVDLVLFDPPYATTTSDWDKELNWSTLWNELRRVSKPTTPILIFSQQPFTSYLVMSNIKDFRYEIIWQKEKGVNFITAKKRIMKCHENVIVFYDKQCTYNPQMVQGDPYVRTQGNCTAGSTHAYVPNPVDKNNPSGLRYPLSVQKFARDSHRDKENRHPTAKPVPLLEWLIRTYSNEGGVVLDPTAGSGTIITACKNTNRNVIAYEKEDNYFKMMQDRL